MAGNPFAPESTTSQFPFFTTSTTSQVFIFPSFTPSPTPSPTSSSSSYALNITVTVTATNSNLPAGSTIQPTDTITGSSGSNRNVISVAVMTFGVIIGLIVVGGCVTLMFTQRKFSKKRIKKGISYIEQENTIFSEEDDNHVVHKINSIKINSISPPLNLPPPPPQRPSQRSPPSPPQNPPPSLSQRPLPQLPPSPPESPPLLLHKSSSFIKSRYSLESEYDPVYTDPNHYQRSSQTTSSSGSYNVIDMPTSIHIEPTRQSKLTNIATTKEFS